MSVLLYVSAILMALTLLTWTRLEIYYHAAFINAQFMSYMVNKERLFINEGSKNLYNSIKVNSHKNGPHNKASGSAKLDLNAILTTTVDEASEQTRTVFKNLLHVLYGHESFFLKAQEENPNLINDLINKIFYANDQLPEKQKIKKPADLGTLILGDESLDEFLYTISKGVEPEKGLPNENPKKNTNTSDDDDVETANESITGYDRIINYLTTEGDGKIRIFLAPKALLLAIYGDNGIVDDIMKKRKELYKQVLRSNKEDREKVKKQASLEFEEQFKNSSFDKILSFAVTKTLPKD